MSWVLAREGLDLGPWEMIASMSQGADTYMSASGDSSAMLGGEPPVERPARHMALLRFVQKQAACSRRT